VSNFFKHLWCRVAYGHVMIPYAVSYNKSGNCRETTHYMCARCLLCQDLYFIGRHSEAD
jgi:hypothetical protein